MRHFILSLAISSVHICFGQQEYSFTNYFEINPFFNPAAAGSEGVQNVTGLFRKQWAGVDGSPITGGVLYDNRFDNYNMGIGGYVFTDVIGATNMTNVAANYSYSLKLNETNFFAFGVDAGVDFYTTNYNRLVYWENDEMFDGQKRSSVLPRAGVGIHYYGEKIYAGLSVPRLLSFNNNYGIGINAQNLPSTVSNYFLTAGYKFPIGKDFEMQTNVLGKYTPRVMPQADLNFMATYNKIIGLGVGYKTLGFATVYLQYTYDEVVKIGYAFDISLTKISNYSSGNHEFIIKYAFLNKKEGISKMK